MRISLPLVLLAAGVVVSAPLAAREPVDSVPGVGDGPALSASAEKMTDLGFANRSRTPGGKADQHTITYSEETADGGSVQVTVDTMTGEVQAPPKP